VPIISAPSTLTMLMAILEYASTFS
jgi:hypothetical protein